MARLGIQLHLLFVLLLLLLLLLTFSLPSRCSSSLQVELPSVLPGILTQGVFAARVAMTDGDISGCACMVRISTVRVSVVVLDEENRMVPWTVVISDCPYTQSPLGTRKTASWWIDWREKVSRVPSRCWAQGSSLIRVFPTSQPAGFLSVNPPKALTITWWPKQTPYNRGTEALWLPGAPQFSQR